MRRKKLLCIILSIFMVINLLPVGVMASDPVEVSDETELINALGQAQDGDLITLKKDITVSQQLVIDADITLDLSGNFLTNTFVNTNGTDIDDRFTLITTANVTIQNGNYVTTAPESTNGVETRGIVASEGNLKLNSVTVQCNGIAVATYSEGGTLTINGSTISGTYAVGSFANKSTVIIERSTLEGSVCGLYHNGSYYGLVMEVEDSTIIGATSATSGTTDDPTGVYISGSKTTHATAGNQEVAFIDCTISGATGIEVKYTDLTLTNCTVTATASTSYDQYNNGSTTTGFAVVSTDNTLAGTTPAPEGTITINSGTYSGEIGLANVYGDEYTGITEATYKIYGGTFDTDVSEYVATGFTQDSTGAVVALTASTAVARIGDNYYSSLQEAFDSISTFMQTIVLLQDVTLNSSIVVKEPEYYTSFDLNGHTITFEYDSDGKFNGEELTENTIGFKLSSGYLSIEDSVGGGSIVAADPYIIPVGATGTTGFHYLHIYDTNVTSSSASTPVVYASGIATIYIYGDTFTNSAGGTVLVEDSTTATIDVRGGTYVGQDPSEFVDTSWYTVAEISSGVYVVGTENAIISAPSSYGSFTTDTDGYAIKNQIVTVTVTPETGYEVVSVTVSNTEMHISFEATEIAANIYQFAMIDGPATVTVTYRPSSTYSIEVIYETGGTAYANNGSSAEAGDTVTITTLPDSGYKVDKVTAVDANGATVAVNESGTNEYTLTMPAADVTVTVTFTAQSQSSGKGEIGGIIYVNEEYHGILLTQNGRTHILSVAHTVDENGYCTVCKAYIGLEEEEESVEITEEVVEIEDPVEAGETDAE